MTLSTRRRTLAQLGGAAGAALWLPPSADALGLATDKIKVIRYYTNPGDVRLAWRSLRSSGRSRSSSCEATMMRRGSILLSWRN